MPFDIALHPIEVIGKLIETSFSHYMCADDLTYSETENYCLHSYNGVSWPHDHGRELSENGFAGLRAKYAERIANFDAAMANGRPTLFIIHHASWVKSVLGKWNDDAARQVMALERIIKNIMISQFRILIISGDDIKPSKKFFHLNGDVFDLIHVPYPYQDTDNYWWATDHYLTEPALRFERAIADRIGANVERLPQER